MYLQRFLSGSWFSPAFKALTHLAKKDPDILTLINQTHQIVRLIDSKKSDKICNNAMLSWYNGQYSKAITQWEELGMILNLQYFFVKFLKRLQFLCQIFVAKYTYIF